MDRIDEKLLKEASDELLNVPDPGSGCRWCCLYTRPRHEKKVAQVCENLDVSFYLPLRRVTHHYKSGKKVHWLPLFTGYVFGCPDTKQRFELSRREQVLSVIEVTDQERFVEELRQIHRGLQVSAELKTVPYLARGQRVEIVRGPFKGIKGVVEQLKGSTRVMLTATMMNSSIPLEVDESCVEPFD